MPIFGIASFREHNNCITIYLLFPCRDVYEMFMQAGLQQEISLSLQAL